MGSYSRRGYKALSFVLIVLTFNFFTFSCSDSVDNVSDELTNVLQKHGMGIEREAKFLEYKGELLSEIPSYNPDIHNPVQIDLRGDDLSGVDLRSKTLELINSTFDTNTIWPEKLLPDDFDPEIILETNKDPGLNIRSLHAQGVDGRGVSVAIIDQPLPTEHVEVVGSLVHYEELIDSGGYASLHGALVSSIMVGKTIGVAPSSRLFYFASYPINEDGETSYLPLAEAIDRVLEINQVLPERDRIRVISISLGFSHDVEGYTEIMDSVERAEDENILVLYTSMEHNTARVFVGLERDPRSDPNVNTEYKLANWWGKPMNDTIDKQIKETTQKALCVPMGSRTYASFTGKSDYSFSSQIGYSVVIPYIAGIYALVVQKEPSITPDQFWKIALDTSDVISVENSGRQYDLKIVNPTALIEELDY